jgi:hypothetical protein
LVLVFSNIFFKDLLKNIFLRIIKKTKGLFNFGVPILHQLNPLFMDIIGYDFALRCYKQMRITKEILEKKKVENYDSNNSIINIFEKSKDGV